MVGKIEHQTHTTLSLDIRKIEIKSVTLFVDGEKAMSIDVPPPTGMALMMLMIFVCYSGSRQDL